MDEQVHLGWVPQPASLQALSAASASSVLAILLQQPLWTLERALWLFFDLRGPSALV